MTRTAGQADRTVIGPSHRRLFGHVRPTGACGAGPRSPGRLITSKAPTRGRPICGSDRVSEALHVPYQRDNRARWIISADPCRLDGCWSAIRCGRSVRDDGLGWADRKS